MAIHLNQTLLISYYGPDNTWYGGADWPIPIANQGRWLSGAQDGSYQSMCVGVAADNGMGSGPCEVAIVQKTVTDGCYDPSQGPLDATASFSVGASGMVLRPAATTTVYTGTKFAHRGRFSFDI
jgi:hypothetical protein